MDVPTDFTLDFITSNGENMIVRPSALAEFANHGLGRTRHPADTSRYHCFLVWRQADEKPVTSVGIEHLADPPDGIVLDCETKETEWRKGYAEGGLQSLIDWADKLGISYIGADPTGGKPAMELMKKLGLKPVGPIRGRWIRDTPTQRRFRP